jgi:hypothetical protein
MECKGNACLDRNVRASHHRAGFARTMYLRARHIRVTHLRARHEVVKQVESWILMVMHVLIRNVRVLNVVMVWNVREMHIWAEMSGQGIIGQGTRGHCI